MKNTDATEPSAWAVHYECSGCGRLSITLYVTSDDSRIAYMHEKMCSWCGRKYTYAPGVVAVEWEW